MLKRSVLIIMAMTSMLLSSWSLVPSLASAATKDQICAGIGAVSGQNDCTAKDGPTLSSAVRSIIQIFSIIIGIVAVIMIMVAGFNFITAAGDSGKISSARSTVIYAIVGLVVAAFAQIIVKFVLERVR